MSTATYNKLLVISAGLFPDAATVDAAIQHLSDRYTIDRHPVDTATMRDADWDKLLKKIQNASIVVTL